MNETAQQAFNNSMMGIIGIATIPFIIAFIIFCLWLYFGFGTLTRLTDIKYKLDDLIDAIRDNGKVAPNYTNNVPDKVTNTEIKTEPQSLKHVEPSAFATEISRELQGLRKPSKFFVISLGSSFVLAILLLVLALILNR